MKNMEITRLVNRLKPLLKNGTSQGIFSAVAAGIYRFRNNKEERLILVEGRTREDTQGKAINEETLFDLASLTKPLCTTLAILSLIGKKEIRWETKIFSVLSCPHLPEYAEITVEQLLSHSAGLIAYLPLYASFPPVVTASAQNDLIMAFLREPLAYKPGTACVYSDIGFMLLGLLVEKVCATPLDIFFRNTIATPLGVHERVLFRPVNSHGASSEQNIAATEQCPWRRKLLQGEVHDEHAWLMNGVAGHAGLFGTIGGVLAMTEYLLHQWRDRATHPNIPNSILQKALTRRYQNHTWCHGFDTPSPEGSSSGKYFSPGSVGHLGYTGTSFWIDPEQERIVVLLSNRVHPSRSNEKIKQFRPLFHDTVIASLQEQ